MQDVKGAAFAQTCLFFEETGAIWQLLNAEEELKLKYRSNTSTNVVIDTIDIWINPHTPNYQYKFDR